MTVSMDHPVGLEPLNAAIAALRLDDVSSDKELCLYFVVPPSMYKDFKVQKIVPAEVVEGQVEGTRLLNTKKPYRTERPIRQYALKLQLMARAPSRNAGGAIYPVGRVRPSRLQPMRMAAMFRPF